MSFSADEDALSGVVWRLPWTASTDAVQLVNCSKSPDRKQQSSCDQWLWLSVVHRVCRRWPTVSFSKCILAHYNSRTKVVGSWNFGHRFHVICAPHVATSGWKVKVTRPRRGQARNTTQLTNTCIFELVGNITITIATSLSETIRKPPLVKP